MLYSIRTYWYETLVSLKVKKLEDFLEHYNKFRDFIGQMAYLFFKGFFVII